MQLPTLWHRARFGDVLQIEETKIDPSICPDRGYYYIGMEDIESNTGQLSNQITTTFGNDIKSPKNSFNKGDVLYGRLRPNLNKVFLAKSDGICSTEIWVLRPCSLLNPAFLAFYLRSTLVCDRLTQSAIGGQLPRVPKEAFIRVPIPIPPLPEQQRIVEILQQADDLRRQRREVTEQIIRVKGVAFYEFFGIPEAPNKKVKNTLEKFAFINPALEPDTELMEDTEVSFIPMSSVDEKSGRISASEIKTYAEVKKGYTPFQEGDVLFAKITPCMENGKAAIAGNLVNGIGFGSTEYHVLRPKNGVTSDFLLGLVRRIEFRELAKRFFVGTSGHQRVSENFLKSHQITPPSKKQLRKYSDFVQILDVLVTNQESQGRRIDSLTRNLHRQAFSGQLTKSWRESHHDELQAWLRDHESCLPAKSTRVRTSEIAPAERKPPARPARRWLLDQLSELQGQVYRTLEEWKGILIPAEDIEAFLTEWPIEHLDDAHDQVLRALNQMAGLGLIARVSLPNDSGSYVTGYRVLREEEFSKSDDLLRLGASA